jgi:hypothetical protein
MKHLRAMGFLVLAGVALLAASAAGQGRPDFSGDWKMNAAKSSFGGLPPPATMSRRITHAEPSLTIVEEQDTPLGNQVTTRKYTTDGVESTFEAAGGQLKGTAVWEDGALVVTTRVDPIGLSFTDRMTLSADGKVMTSVVLVRSPQGDVEVSIAFDRQ